MELPALVIHTSLEAEIRGFLPKKLPRFSVKTFSSESSAFYKGTVLSQLTNSPYCVVFVPGEWTADVPPPPHDILLRCVTGLVRFVIWKPLVSPRWSFPNVLIPESMDKDLVQMNVNHTLRAAGWGLHTSMPAGAHIWTERIYSMEKLRARASSSVELLTQRDSIFTPVANRIAEGLKGLIASAFGNRENLPGTKPVVFQMGIHQGIVAHSIRWQGEMMSTQDWLSPSDPWKAVLRGHSNLGVQFSLETEETEVTVVNLPMPLREVHDPRPYIIDSMTLERLEASRELVNEAASFQYETFE
jgi:hypothetical protein